MKNLKIFLTLSFLFGIATSNAQVGVNVTIGTPPAWAPSTPAGTEYYYLPDVDSYYDIRTTEYVYLTNGRWIRSRSLPVAYRAYRPTAARTIVINDYHGRSPWVNHKVHVVKYKGPKKVVVVKGNRGHGKGHGKH